MKRKMVKSISMVCSASSKEPTNDEEDRQLPVFFLSKIYQ